MANCFNWFYSALGLSIEIEFNIKQTDFIKELFLLERFNNQSQLGRNAKL